ncbi:hypothetical protein [Sulfurimonas sp.]|uniref:hypothetical protein n=1 Tax=Sulfurimonas sp. TaxID=2022749 RepID=UPI002B472690|nr:hypothetical protein [Sulfurimonas sp.]
MGKSMVTQKLGERTITNYFPAGHADALSFAEAVMDGELTVYSQTTPVGSDQADESFAVNVMIQQNSDNRKTYLKFVLKATKDEIDLFPALQGKTFNGIKADKVVVVSSRLQAH